VATAQRLNKGAIGGVAALDEGNDDVRGLALRVVPLAVSLLFGVVVDGDDAASIVSGMSLKSSV
jgi:hypothetical protein